ncbi:hypothetical protein FDECE_11633 [Fusarium decemcellulare]|nr:hypothetical protein FDECE_11633 [Fusarium decemcellulare]
MDLGSYDPIQGCGDLEYLDVEELAPGGAAEFQQAIREDARVVRHHAPGGSNSYGVAPPAPAHLDLPQSGRGQNQACPTLPSINSSIPTPPGTTSSGQASSRRATTIERKCLLVRVNTKRQLTKLENIDVSPVTNDQFLFDEIRRVYYDIWQEHE